MDAVLYKLVKNYVDTYKDEQYYIGQVATRGRYNEGKLAAGTAKQMMSRIQHHARDFMNKFNLIFVNYHSNNEAFTGADATVKCSIEYPIGTFTRVKFSGSDSGIIPDGGQLISDPINLFIPSNAVFREWTFFSCTEGVPYATTSQNVDKGVYGQTVTDMTASGGTMSGAQLTYGATAIIGKTNRPSVLIVGDSRAGNQDYIAYATNDGGNVSRSIGSAHAYINMAVGGQTVWQIRDQSAKRNTFLQYCTHVVISAGINDLIGSNASNAFSDLTSLVAIYSPTKSTYVVTVEPNTTSTDGWVTTENQTKWVDDITKRVAYNEMIRGGVVGATAYFDIADAVETARNSGIWQAKFTSDGLHETVRGSLAIFASGKVNPAIFAR